MNKLDLNKVADKFEMINSENRLFFNTETGEFDFYSDPVYYGIDDDFARFEDDCWIAAPSQFGLGEYDIMVDFAKSITEPRANELFCLALDGKGAFRRFKDVLYRVDLADEWYAFRHKAYVKIAKEWCDDNDFEYTGDE